jgi:hypothetical protein
MEVVGVAGNARLNSLREPLGCISQCAAGGVRSFFRWHSCCPLLVRLGIDVSPQFPIEVRFPILPPRQ